MKQLGKILYMIDKDSSFTWWPACKFNQIKLAASFESTRVYPTRQTISGDTISNVSWMWVFYQRSQTTLLKSFKFEYCQTLTHGRLSLKIFRQMSSKLSKYLYKHTKQFPIPFPTFVDQYRYTLFSVYDAQILLNSVSYLYCFRMMDIKEKNGIQNNDEKKVKFIANISNLKTRT